MASASGGGYGLGPFFVTDDGVVYAAGSGRPPESYVSDVEVSAGATKNPLRILRHAVRRLLGDAPLRLR